MQDLLGAAAGTPMTRAEYLADFWDRFWRVGSHGIWKVERAQHFREPGYDVWEAFDEGDWPESMRRLEAGRPQIAAENHRLRGLGTTLHWVRVVETPLSAYVRWNLTVLRVREDYGTDARIVAADRLGPLETTGQLPELVVLGAAALYELRYDSAGTLVGACRYTDSDLVTQARNTIATLHAGGERLSTYFAREVAATLPTADS
jgi:hypothetical protein